jgi:hypothetical protein
VAFATMSNRPKRPGMGRNGSTRAIAQREAIVCPAPSSERLIKPGAWAVADAINDIDDAKNAPHELAELRQLDRDRDAISPLDLVQRAPRTPQRRVDEDRRDATCARSDSPRP